MVGVIHLSECWMLVNALLLGKPSFLASKPLPPQSLSPKRGTKALISAQDGVGVAFDCFLWTREVRSVSQEVVLWKVGKAKLRNILEGEASCLYLGGQFLNGEVLGRTFGGHIRMVKCPIAPWAGILQGCPFPPWPVSPFLFEKILFIQMSLPRRRMYHWPDAPSSVRGCILGQILIKS